MAWEVLFHDEFLDEFNAFSEEVQDSIFEKSRLLAEFGAQLGRPYVDTLNGSDYPNMKELRLSADNGVWRVAFAFDVERKAILLVAGDKKSRRQRQFYNDLIRIADERFKNHLNTIKKKQ